MTLIEIDNYMTEKASRKKDTEPVTFRMDSTIRLMWKELCDEEHRTPVNLVEMLILERYKHVFGDEKYEQAILQRKISH